MKNDSLSFGPAAASEKKIGGPPNQISLIGWYIRTRAGKLNPRRL
jgi:hypothetical protein